MTDEKAGEKLVEGLEKKSDMCRALAQQLRAMAGHDSLKSKQADILRQAEEWERLAALAEEEEAKA